MSIPTVALNEDSPAGSDAINLGDNKIREYKTQVREICEVDHDFPSSSNSLTAGQHKKVTLQEQANLGTGAVGATLLGSQTTDGKGELTYTDEADNDIQITKDGKIHAPSLAGVYPAADVAALATMMNLIYPVGYVITLGVSTNPGTLLGIGTWTAIAGRVIVGIDGTQTEFDTLDETGGAKTHQLSAAEMPSHTHSYTTGGGSSGYAPGGWGVNQGQSVATTSAGSDTAHNNLQPYIVKYCWQRTA